MIRSELLLWSYYQALLQKFSKYKNSHRMMPYFLWAFLVVFFFLKKKRKNLESVTFDVIGKQSIEPNTQYVFARQLSSSVRAKNILSFCFGNSIHFAEIRAPMLLIFVTLSELNEVLFNPFTMISSLKRCKSLFDSFSLT